MCIFVFVCALRLCVCVYVIFVCMYAFISVQMKQDVKYEMESIYIRYVCVHNGLLIYFFLYTYVIEYFATTVFIGAF